MSGVVFKPETVRTPDERFKKTKEGCRLMSELLDCVVCYHNHSGLLNSSGESPCMFWGVSHKSLVCVQNIKAPQRTIHGSPDKRQSMFGFSQSLIRGDENDIAATTSCMARVRSISSCCDPKVFFVCYPTVLGGVGGLAWDDQPTLQNRRRRC